MLNSHINGIDHKFKKMLHPRLIDTQTGLLGSFATKRFDNIYIYEYS